MPVSGPKQQSAQDQHVQRPLQQLDSVGGSVWHTVSRDSTRIGTLARSPAAVSGFNAFYTTSGRCILMNSTHILIAFVLLAGLVLAVLVLMVFLHMRCRGSMRRVRAVG